MAKKKFVLVQTCPICKLRITDIKDSCVQIESGRRVHVECHQKDAMAKARERLKNDLRNESGD